MKFFLGSSSPRRLELIKYLGITPHVIKSEYEERAYKIDEDINSYILELARNKGLDILSRHQCEFLITADTLVVCEGRVLGKPSSKENAKEILNFLAGKTQEVKTAICIFKNKNLAEEFIETSEVDFKNDLEHEINAYLEFASYMDKAGAYGIQEHGRSFVSEVRGDYTNIIGLPVRRVLDYLIKEFGVNWRNHFE